MRFSSCAFPLIILTLIAASVKSSTNVYLNIGSLTRGLRLNGGIFYVIEPILFSGCLKECVLRRKCKIITFHSSKLRCELGDSISDTELSTDLFYVTTDPSQWPIAEELVGSCANHTCPSGTKCIAVGKTQTRCFYAECSPPRNLLFVEEQTTYSVGYTHTYSCKAGYVKYGGSSQITCQPDGKWTSVNFNCILSACNTNAGFTDGVICFKKFTIWRSPSGAKTVCKENGARLAVIDNAEKFEHVKSSGGGHVDGSDNNEEGVWRYSDGSLATYLPWSSYYGSRGSSYNCLYLAYSGVEDISCADWYYFFCEIP